MSTVNIYVVSDMAYTRLTTKLNSIDSSIVEALIVWGLMINSIFVSIGALKDYMYDAC